MPRHTATESANQCHLVRTIWTMSWSVIVSTFSLRWGCMGCSGMTVYLMVVMVMMSVATDTTVPASER